MVTFDFADRVVIVTGAAGALGQAVVRAFQAAKAKLALVDHTSNRLQRLFPDMADQPDCLFVHSVDVTQPDAVEAMVQAVVGHFGRIDVLVNTVGGFRAGTPVHETPLSTWEYLLDLNARSVFAASRAVIPHLTQQRSGKIISVAARAALSGGANVAAYSASKSAVVRLTESMDAELRDLGINVNCVLPAIIDTPANRQAMPRADHTRWTPPTAIADVILFLASDAARAVHGAAIPV